MNRSGVSFHKYNNTCIQGGSLASLSHHSVVVGRPNKISSVVSVKDELLVELNHCNTF